MPANSPDPIAFRRSFRRWARSVRTPLMVRSVLAGLCAGAGLALVASLVGWWFRLEGARGWSWGVPLALGAAAGGAWGVLRRLGEREVALYLDAKLGSFETLSTAVGARDGSQAAAALALQRARELLETRSPAEARPRVLRRWQLGLLPLVSALVVVAQLPGRPQAAEAASPPDRALVRLEKLTGLDAARALGSLEAPPEQREALEKIAREAAQLRRELSTGLPRREAQARMAKLRDALRSERPTFGDRESRAGLEAAIDALSKHAELRAAAQALGNGDLAAFDARMRELSERLEQRDREIARQALEEAARRAAERGAGALEQFLREQQQLLSEREAVARLLRELGEALGDELGGPDGERLRQLADARDVRALGTLSEALADALEQLSDEQLERLAKHLAEAARQQGSAPQALSQEELARMARELGTPEGKRALAERLRELSQQPLGQTARRQRALDDADRGAAEVERQLGVLAPMPAGGPPNGSQGPPPPSGNGPSGGGPGPGEGGPNAHPSGSTPEVDGKPLNARAPARVDPSAPSSGVTVGRAASRPGETANRRGEGALGSVAPEELSGIERSEVPKAYREQVGRYFQP